MEPFSYIIHYPAALHEMTLIYKRDLEKKKSVPSKNKEKK